MHRVGAEKLSQCVNHIMVTVYPGVKCVFFKYSETLLQRSQSKLGQTDLNREVTILFVR